MGKKFEGELFWCELCDNKAELDMTTPPHLQIIKMSITTSSIIATIALHNVLHIHFTSVAQTEAPTSQNVLSQVSPAHFIPFLRLRKPLRSKDGGVWASNQVA